MLRLVHVPPVVTSQPRCLRFCLESEDTRRCGETASPHVVIDVVIVNREAVRGGEGPRDLISYRGRACGVWRS